MKTYCDDYLLIDEDKKIMKVYTAECVNTVHYISYHIWNINGKLSFTVIDDRHKLHYIVYNNDGGSVFNEDNDEYNRCCELDKMFADCQDEIEEDDERYEDYQLYLSFFDIDGIAPVYFRNGMLFISDDCNDIVFNIDDDYGVAVLDDYCNEINIIKIEDFFKIDSEYKGDLFYTVNAEGSSFVIYRVESDGCREIYRHHVLCSRHTDEPFVCEMMFDGKKVYYGVSKCKECPSYMEYAYNDEVFFESAEIVFIPCYQQMIPDNAGMVTGILDDTVFEVFTDANLWSVIDSYGFIRDSD